MTLDIPAPENDDVQRLGRVVEALLDGDDDRAAAELAPIAGITCLQRPIVKMPELARGEWPQGTGKRTKNPPDQIIGEIYVRDGFTCAYCSRMTIPLSILRLLSQRFGDAFAYHLNWKMSVAHRLYWDITTSLDHVVPVSGGGDWQARDNLTTACSRCQYQKGNLRLDLLGWERLHQRSEWDGLTVRYRELWERLGRPDGRYQSHWIACFEAARADGAPQPTMTSRQSRRHAPAGAGSSPDQPLVGDRTENVSPNATETRQNLRLLELFQDHADDAIAFSQNTAWGLKRRRLIERIAGTDRTTGRRRIFYRLTPRGRALLQRLLNKTDSP